MGLRISIIFQGPLDERPPEFNFQGALTHSEACILKTREAYPDAEIVLSTWAPHSRLSKIVDKLVVNQDPGCLLSKDGGQNYLSNINRQIVSTCGGLRVATGIYVIKLRTDCWLNSDDGIGLYLKLSARYPRPSFFKKPILIGARGCAQPERWPALFHIDDMFQFGLREDLLSLWDISYCSDEYIGWCDEKLIPIWRRGGMGNRIERMAPEQYILSQFLEKNGICVDIKSILGGPISSYFISEYILASHFIPRPGVECGVGLPPRLARYDIPDNFSYRNDYVLLGWLGRHPFWLKLYVWTKSPLYVVSCFFWFLRGAVKRWTCNI